MKNKHYIDLATRMGWAILSEDGVIIHGYTELDKDRKTKTYTSSQCRKTLPKEVKFSIQDAEIERIKHDKKLTLNVWNKNNGSYEQLSYEFEKNVIPSLRFHEIYETTDKGYCLIKTKKGIITLSKQEQLEKLWSFLVTANVGDEFIIEEPNTTGLFSSRKTLALFGVADLVIGDYKEIKASVWFKWITNELQHLKVWKVGKNQHNVDRKKTSIAIASFLMNKEIKDDNEADAICMMFYDNQELFKAKVEKRRELKCLEDWLQNL